MQRAELTLFTCKPGQRFAEKLPKEVDKIRFESQGHIWNNNFDDFLNKLGTKLSLVETTEFADGEVKTELESSVRGKDVFLVQSIVDKNDLHKRIFETFFAIDAIKGAGASYVNIIVPFLPYSRQDKRRGRESLSAKVLAGLFDSIEPKNIRTTLITMDLHTDQIAGYYNNTKIENLKPGSTLINYLKENHKEILENLVVVSPDAGGAARAEFYSKRLEIDMAQMIKRRSYVKANLVEEIRLLGNVKDKNVLIVDDMIDTAGSLVKAVDELKENGALDIYGICAHPLFSYPAIERIGNLYSKGFLKGVIGTDSIMYSDEFLDKSTWFKQASIAPLIARVVYNINNNLSVSSLFD